MESPGLQRIRYTKRDRVARITIDRPEVRNALDQEAHRELRAAFEDFRDDPEVWVAVLTGAGDKAFCAGSDVKYLRKLTSGELIHSTPYGGITSDFECWKPIIASVNGFAFGGGTELALACDLVVAADTATFGLPEPYFGMIAGAGGLLRLPRQLPQKLAMELILTGRKIDAATALSMGLVNRVVPVADLAAATDALISEILALSPAAVRHSKRIALATMNSTLAEAEVVQQELVSELMATNDAKEGLVAFLEKRPPVWTNS